MSWYDCDPRSGQRAHTLYTHANIVLGENASSFVYGIFITITLFGLCVPMHLGVRNSEYSQLLATCFVPNERVLLTHCDCDVVFIFDMVTGSSVGSDATRRQKRHRTTGTTEWI